MKSANILNIGNCHVISVPSPTSVKNGMRPIAWIGSNMISKLYSMHAIFNGCQGYCLTDDFSSEVLSMLPELTILDGEILDESKVELESDKDSPEELCPDEPETGTRKPQIVAALTLLISELETLEDIQELQKELRNRSAKIKETNADVFTV